MLIETEKLVAKAKPCRAPMTLNMHLTKDGKLFEDPERKQRLARKSNYLTVTHPDIAYSVGVVNQFVTSSRIHH